jgi:hypothetical protein
MDFTSHHSFLRVRRDQFLPNCKKTHPIVYMKGSSTSGKKNKKKYSSLLVYYNFYSSKPL